MKFINFLLSLLFSAHILYAAPQWVQLTNDGRAGASPEVEITEANLNGMKITFKMPGVLMDKERYNSADYDTVKIPGAEPSLQVGEPDVQSLGYLIQILKGDFLDIEVINSDKKILKGIKLLPAKEYPLRCGSGAPRVVFKRNYFSDGFYPEKIVDAGEAGNLRDILVSRLEINPVRYNSHTKELELYSNIEIKVKYSGTREDNKFDFNKHSRSFEEVMKRNVINFRSNFSKTYPKEVMLLIAADIYIDDSQSMLQRFIEKKKMLGIDVVAKKVSEIGKTNTIIKEYVQNAYDNWDIAPTYLLFVGNEHTVPTFKRNTSSGSAASDYIYSLLAGNDIFPDLFYGRIISDDINGANVQLNKIINYEWYPEMASTWYKKGTGIASSEGSNPSDKDYVLQIKEVLRNNTYDHVDDFFQGSGNATIANINLALNEGRSWLTYLGHGNGTSWSNTNNGAYGNASINLLENGYKLPIIIDVACKNGQFDSNYECFGERWVRGGTVENPKGAVSYWGGSVNISWHPPAIMARGIAKKHFGKPVHTLGGSMIAGQIYLSEHSGTGKNVEDNFVWYNLFGDPSMLVRTDMPREFIFGGNNVIGLGEESYKGNIGVSGARVTLYGEVSGIVATAISNASGNFELRFEPFTSPENLTVVTYKYNYKPLAKEIDLVPLDSAFLVFDNLKVTNENYYQDKKPNPGETISYDLVVKNIGVKPANNVLFKFSTESKQVENFTKQIRVDKIENNSLMAVKNFQFTLVNDVVNSMVIPFNVEWSTASESGKFNLMFTVAAAEMVFTSAKVDWDENGNGFVEPGEKFRIKVGLRNEGEIPSLSDAFKLISNSSNLYISNPNIVFSEIDPGKEHYGYVDAQVKHDTPNGSRIDLDILTDNNVIIENVLTIPIGVKIKKILDYNGPSLPILDMQKTVSTIQGPKGVVTNLRVRLDILHTYIGDLVIKLFSPEGVEVLLRSKTGGSSHNINVWVPDDMIPLESLSKFNGNLSEGNWTLEIADTGRGDEGSLKSWKLEFEGYF